MATIRNPNYTFDEDVTLCDSYKEICQDPIIGRYQPSNQLWARVLEKFVSLGGTPRPQRSIESRIGVIKKAMSKLIACVEQVERLNPSGASESDILRRAKVLYVNDPSTKSKSFKFDHVWHTMKDYQQWDNTTRKPREQCNEEMESHVSPEPSLSPFTINLSDENVSGSGGSSSSRRPDGVKKSKMKKKRAEDISAIVNTVHEDNEKLLAYLKEAGEKKERDREIRREEVARRARLDEATTAAEENRIIMIDLDTISDPRKREFVRMQQENIYRKNAESLQQPPANDTFGMYGVNFGDLGGSGSNLGPF